MSRTWLRMGLLGAALLVGSQTVPASAAPLPAPDRDVFKAANAVETVKWKCGPWNCYWKPGYAGWIPPKARVWGPPRAAGCFWRRSWAGWVHICP